MSTLLLKLILVPTLVLLITLAGRRWGSSVAGWLAGFPVVAGPTLLVIAIDQGGDFAAGAAHGTLTAILANVSFILTYAWAALRSPWYGAAIASIGAFGLVATVLLALDLTSLQAFSITWLGLFVASRCFPRKAPLTPERPRSVWELPARCACAWALSFAVMQLAQQLGPDASGMLAAFPILGLLLGVFSHVSSGGAGSAQLLAGMVRGLYAFTTFCILLALMLSQFGIGAAFSFGVGGALLVQLLTFKRAKSPAE